MAKKTVLVIDDDKDIRETLTTALEAEDYRVFSASNGKTALELMKGKKPEDIGCILLDLMMPVMDGHEFLRRLHTDFDRFNDIPVVVATAMGVPVDSISIPYPVSRLQKPMELDQLYKVLDMARGLQPSQKEG